MRKNIFKKTDHEFITNINKLHNFVDFDDSIILVKNNKTKVSLENFILDIIISYCKNKIETRSLKIKLNINNVQLFLFYALTNLLYS
jgi:hypothetical protein